MAAETPKQHSPAAPAPVPTPTAAAPVARRARRPIEPMSHDEVSDKIAQILRVLGRTTSGDKRKILGRLGKLFAEET